MLGNLHYGKWLGFRLPREVRESEMMPEMAVEPMTIVTGSLVGTLHVLTEHQFCFLSSERAGLSSSQRKAWVWPTNPHFHTSEFVCCLYFKNPFTETVPEMSVRSCFRPLCVGNIWLGRMHFRCGSTGAQGLSQDTVVTSLFEATWCSSRPPGAAPFPLHQRGSCPSRLEASS